MLRCKTAPLACPVLLWSGLLVGMDWHAAEGVAELLSSFRDGDTACCIASLQIRREVLEARKNDFSDLIKFK